LQKTSKLLLGFGISNIEKLVKRFFVSLRRCSHLYI